MTDMGRIRAWLDEHGVEYVRGYRVGGIEMNTDSVTQAMVRGHWVSIDGDGDEPDAPLAIIDVTAEDVLAFLGATCG